MNTPNLAVQKEFIKHLCSQSSLDENEDLIALQPWGERIDAGADTCSLKPQKPWVLDRKNESLLNQALTRMVELNSQGYAVGIGLHRLETKEGGRKNNNIKEGRCVFVDFDGKNETECVAFKSALKKFTLLSGTAPSMVVSSSQFGYHLYWICEPFSLEDNEHNFYISVIHKLASFFSSDSGVTDKARILRVPGFLHQKKESFQSLIVSSNERVYSISQISEELIGLEKTIANNHHAGTEFGLLKQVKLEGSVKGLKDRAQVARSALTGEGRPKLNLFDCPEIGEGDRHHALIGLSFLAYKQGLSAKDAHKVLESINQKSFIPPISEDRIKRGEFSDIIAWVYKLKKEETELEESKIREAAKDAAIEEVKDISVDAVLGIKSDPFLNSLMNDNLNVKSAKDLGISRSSEDTTIAMTKEGRGITKKSYDITFPATVAVELMEDAIKYLKVNFVDWNGYKWVGFRTTGGSVRWKILEDHSLDAFVKEVLRALNNGGDASFIAKTKKDEISKKPITPFHYSQIAKCMELDDRRFHIIDEEYIRKHPALKSGFNLIVENGYFKCDGDIHSEIVFIPNESIGLETPSILPWCVGGINGDKEFSKECPQFEAFLMDVFTGSRTGEDDVEVIQMRLERIWLLLAFACMDAHPYSFGFFLFGTSGSGKSTFIDALTKIVGKDKIANGTISNFNNEFITDAFPGNKVYALDEYSSGSDAQKANFYNFFKLLCDGSSTTLNVVGKGKRGRKVNLDLCLIAQGNEPPTFRDVQGAGNRRLQLFETFGSYTEDGVDIVGHLRDYIELEMEAILWNIALRCKSLFLNCSEKRKGIPVVDLFTLNTCAEDRELKEDINKSNDKLGSSVMTLFQYSSNPDDIISTKDIVTVIKSYLRTQNITHFSTDGRMGTMIAGALRILRCKRVRRRLHKEEVAAGTTALIRGYSHIDFTREGRTFAETALLSFQGRTDNAFCE